MRQMVNLTTNKKNITEISIQNLKNIFFLCCHNDKELPTVGKTSDVAGAQPSGSSNDTNIRNFSPFSV